MSYFSDNCRCCLADVSCLDISAYFSLDDQIHSSDFSDLVEKSYKIILEEYTGFKVKPGEPYNLCTSCRSKLLESWKFWKQLKNTQTVLEAVVKDEDHIDEGLKKNDNNVNTSEAPEQINNISSAVDLALGDETRDILAYLAEDLNISEECKNIDTLPPLHLDLDLEALISGDPAPKFQSSPKKFICPFSPTKKYKHLEMHLIRKHRHMKNIQCPTEGCHRLFYTIEMRDQHLKRDCRRRPNVFKKEDQKIFFCKFCNRFFDCYRKVRSHEDTHRKKLKSNKVAQFQCDICQKRFMLKDKLRMHIESFHLKQKKLKCHICAIVFQSNSGYRYHMKMNHSPTQETFKCDYCSYETRINFMLNRHLKRHQVNNIVHDVQTEHICITCGRSFSSALKLKNHQSQHQPRQFTCSECNRSFKNRDTLTRHMEKHFALLQCKDCFISFINEKSLKEHIERVHGALKGIVLCDMPKRQRNRDVLLNESSTTSGNLLEDFDNELFLNFHSNYID